ncbi:MotA/TolQ/ExbB proton channel family protein [uncultured Roseobacter sp.]|uniref:MotA/TolQ/ExbB proton channel family protein n=1 Tax=uncultured Roseobacter sp. TaxID=114847 RepID=UPI002622C430|nr:MotA/TolQ/ExbB proton channel family protein [uncultured Roseobacter sp.]
MIKPFLLAILLMGFSAAFAQEAAGPAASTDTPVLPAPEVGSETVDVVPPDTGEAEAPPRPASEAAPENRPVATGRVPPSPSVASEPGVAHAGPTAESALIRAQAFLQDGGPVVWAIAALSVLTLALILWKIWRLARVGAWSRGKASQSVELFEGGNLEQALVLVKGRRGIRSKVMATALGAIEQLPEDRAREETARVAKRELASARVGLGALELIATIAPLLGLLGTVLGMIAAFQALQAAGSKADPALLAGGIWEALLTTAAGMTVAIPASVALTWFESVIDRIRGDIEDNATRLFVAKQPGHLKMAAQ